MPGMNKTNRKNKNINEKPLNKLHKRITKKLLGNIDINLKVNDKQKKKFVNKINNEFEKNGLSKIYTEKKFYEAYSNKKYRYNFLLRKNNKNNNKKKIDNKNNDILDNDNNYINFMFDLFITDIPTMVYK